MTAILAVVSDIHANSTVAVCPPSVNLDDGGTYRATKAQAWLWANWLDYWKQVKKARKKKQKLYVVLNGDLVDGDHHGTPQIISRNMADQHKIALKVLQPVLKLKPDYLFIVRGTEVHTGKSAQWEEFLAGDLEAIPDDVTGTKSWFDLPLEVEDVFFHFAHHGRGGYRPWTFANASQMLAAELVMEYADCDNMPKVAIRSHTHRPADSYDNYKVRVIQTPSWQLSTAFGHRIAPGQILPVGGLIFRVTGEEYDLSKVTYQPQRRRAWRAT